MRAKEELKLRDTHIHRTHTPLVLLFTAIVFWTVLINVMNQISACTRPSSNLSEAHLGYTYKQYIWPHTISQLVTMFSSALVCFRVFAVVFY
jgi:hypothetical protein